MCICHHSFTVDAGQLYFELNVNVQNYVEKMTITCSLMIRHLSDTTTILTTEKGIDSSSIDPSTYKCWKSVPATLKATNNLNQANIRQF